MTTPEFSLDPQDWDELARIGHRMIDDMLAYVRGARERPVWQRMPDAVRDRFKMPLPVQETGAGVIYDDFLRDVLPHAHGNNHPRFWGWVNGSGTVLGAYADLLTAILNSNGAGFDHAVVALEQQVLEWQKEMMRFPSTASGLLVSGGSIANLIGIAVARNHAAGHDVGTRGMDQREPMRLYCSTETHSSITKAAALMGIGSGHVKQIAVKEDYTIDLSALRAAIAADRSQNRHPFCIVGNAGTVNTGATDDLESLADIAAGEGLWFHVDGAFGAMAQISPGLRHITAGIERADSIAYDLHKWLHVPIDVGCVLIRDAEAHRRTFQSLPEYLTRLSGGVAGIPPIFSDLGIELTRRGRGLKVWMSMREHGIERFAATIEANVRQAQHLADLIRSAAELELMAPAPLNVVCFRYRGDDAVNERILVALQERGLAVPSSTRLNGRFAIRAAITNHRTMMADMDFLVDAVLSIGREITAGQAGACAV